MGLQNSVGVLQPLLHNLDDLGTYQTGEATAETKTETETETEIETEMTFE